MDSYKYEQALLSPLYGAVGGVFSGTLGKFSLSFFRPDIAYVAGSIATFATFGAISYPLMAFPAYLIDKAQDSNFLSTSPNLKYFLLTTGQLLNQLAALSLTAVMLGMPPLGATVITMMVIPVSLCLIANVIRTIASYLTDNLNTDTQTEMEQTTPAILQ